MLLGRNIGLVLLSVWLGFGFALRGVYDGLLVVLGLLGLGLAVLLTLGTPHERRWHRYGLVGADVAALAIAAMTLPLLAGADVPRVFIFRAYGIHYLFFLVAASALALMPMLVLFTGIAVTA